METTEAFRWSRDHIVSLDTSDLWAIVRSTRTDNERGANAVSWATAEITRRSFDCSFARSLGARIA